MSPKKLNTLIAQTRKWIVENGQTASKDQWLKRLDAAKSELDQKPEIPIALVGSTGAGKSTLLNALLRHSVLAVSDMKPCTAVVTIVKYRESPEFVAQITFLTEAEWREEIRLLIKQSSSEADQDEQVDLLEWDQINKSTQDKFRAVYGLEDLPPNLNELDLPSDIEALMRPGSPPKDIRETDPKMFKKALKTYLSSDGRYWPLVKTVMISGPFDSLRSGAMLIDLPGMNDPNEAREQVTRKWLTNAPFIWVVFNMKRSITKDIRTLLIEQKLLRKLLLDGKSDALTLVGTHADEYGEDSTEELGLDEDASPSRIIGERARRVTADVSGMLQEMAAELAGEAIHNEGALRRLKENLRRTSVFSVSSPAYMKLENIGVHRRDYGLTSSPETGIPGLTEHLTKLCKQYGVETHAHYVGEKVKLLLEEILQSLNRRKTLGVRQRKELQKRNDEIRRLLQQPKAELLQRLEQTEAVQVESFRDHQSQFENKLDFAVAQARNQLSHRVQQWGNIHWATLRATVVRKGAFTSPSSGIRYDLNSDIAEALLSALPLVWDDFFGIYLGKRIVEIREKLKSGIEVFLAKEQANAKSTDQFDEKELELLVKEFDVARRSIDFNVDAVLSGFEKTIRRVRSDLALAIGETIQQMMIQSYERAADEHGTGMKKRMLAVLEQHTQRIKDQLFTTIQHDLKEGINELGVQFSDKIKTLRENAIEHADRALSNLGLGNIVVQATLTETELSAVETEIHNIEQIVVQLELQEALL